MKIIHAAETVKGGVATVLRSLIKDQYQSGLTVCLVAPISQIDEIGLTGQYREFLFAYRRRNLAALLAFFMAFMKAVAAERPDIVHLHSSLAGALGRIALLFLLPIARPTVIYCPHAWGSTMAISDRKRSIYRGVERILSHLTDGIICISQFERREGIASGINPSKLFHIYNGVAFDEKKYSNPYKNNKINILFVGRFDTQKGFDMLIAAMQLVSDDRLHLTAIGAPVHGGAEPIELPNVTYKGWLTAHQLAPFYQHAAALVVPSRWEGFGLVAAEAMSFGTPVIASNVGALPELVRPNISGILFSPNSNDIAAVLDQIDIENLHKMRTSAFAHYNHLFTEAQMNKNIYYLYQYLQDKRTRCY